MRYGIEQVLQLLVKLVRFLLLHAHAYDKNTILVYLPCPSIVVG